MIRKVLAVAAFVAAFGLIAPAGAATIVNGDFEVGTTAGWTQTNATCCLGAWYVYGGTFAPVSGFPIVAPPQGMLAAVTDQFGPSSQILHQDLVLEADAGHAVKLTYFWFNRNTAFVIGPDLGIGAPNQQYRIDVVKTTAPIISTAPGDVLANIVETPVGSPLTKLPTTVTTDLSSLAGQTVRLRAAVADTL